MTRSSPLIKKQLDGFGKRVKCKVVCNFWVHARNVYIDANALIAYFPNRVSIVVGENL